MGRERYENEGAPVYALRHHIVNCQVGRGADVTVRQLLKDDRCISSAQSAPTHILPVRQVSSHGSCLKGMCLKHQPCYAMIP